MADMDTGYEAYELYLDENEENIAQGKEFLLTVLDLNDMLSKVVRCTVTASSEGEGADLWIRSTGREDLLPNSWKINVLEELDDDSEEVQNMRKREVSIKDTGRMGVTEAKKKKKE